MSEPLTIEINGQSITADMETWERVQGEISARRVADMTAHQEAQRAAGQVWTIKWTDHLGRAKEECFSLAETISYAHWLLEVHGVSVKEIHDSTGTLVTLHELEAQYGAAHGDKPRQEG